MGWSYYEKERRQMDTKNSVIDSSRRKRPRGRPPTRSADVFVARMDQLNSQLVMSNGTGPCERRRRSLIANSWMTLARDRNGWKQC
ncbi:unnamed protein product [Strongylus vulgaris]|uniref:Uncharacterized protein n=1 Tax=Strongylus vulgaris TaxID=40348 RepID=A0A3P7LG76_STRVU|nr:unnamed protein product [Strongylus vulgaris]